MKILIGLLLSLCTQSFFLNKITSKELDLLDAYELNINDVPLFGHVNSQIDAWGMPSELIQEKIVKEFEAKEDALSIIQAFSDFTTVKYSGLELWCFPDLESIPCNIDFRVLGKNIEYGEIHFNQEYEIVDFKEHFPNSYNNTPQMPQSFFSMSTGNNSLDLKSFFVERKTRSDENERPLVEFTFKENKLIYIFFVNF